MSEENNNITTESAPAVEAPSLSLNDLQNAAQVIDAAVSRGAFRAGEAAQVGAVYNKLTAFVQAKHSHKLLPNRRSIQWQI